ncbi:murein transglycosylase A [Kordiimonas sp. SCSIO 12610]|uniref:murein transglycosylase A n=1 Tax=Kordiimonas sp. SCSIO 12610 TaxID=2829597 RepID=UPI00210D173C|nr:MltA domain-containing protein [Kordiimonas sp. SCSIO 12610]UTW55441.1 MltA domain-containing protein [Kordiimonas sp. SCSIO 12610]
MRQIFGYIGAALALILVVIIALYYLSPKQTKALTFDRVDFAELPGWVDSQDINGGFKAFLKTCDSLLKKADGARLQGAQIGGTAADWKPVCNAANAINRLSMVEVRTFYEANFKAFEVSLNGNHEGLFTGYFEPLLKGSFKKSDRFQHAIYSLPKDLVSVDLGRFRPDLKGERIAGKIQNNRLIPYEDRAAIDTGALEQKADVLLWVDSPIDVFFLHIQGSGRVEMPDGTLQGVGYAGQNGHVYRAIGRDLIDMGEIERENISMQSIRSWLEKNTDSAQALMQKNRSYIFFRLLDGTDGPFGSAGVGLTAGHSLAIDLRHLPMHAPVWLSASYPAANGNQNVQMDRLMVAQDTGGAIRGEIRGDVFWGFGDEAAAIAGKMQNTGRYWILLPNLLADKLIAAK